MDAKGKDEAKNRRSEETLARRVGEALDQMNPTSAIECPDAEIIAAYSDHGLALDETLHWESHFATCARCRKILRVLAASSDTPLAESEVARLGELVAAAHVPARAAAEPSKVPQPNAWDWRVRWLAPALGVAAVVAVWFAMRPPWKGTEQATSTTLVAQAPREAPPNLGPTDRVSTNFARADKQAAGNLSGPPTTKTPAVDSRSKVAAVDAAQAKNELREAAPNQVANSDALQKMADLDKLAKEPGARSGVTAPPAPVALPPSTAQTITGGLAATPPSNAKSAADLSPQRAAASPAPPPPLPSETSAPTGTPVPSAPLPQARAKAEVAPAVPQQPGAANQPVTASEAAPTVEATNGRAYAARALASPAKKSAILFSAPSGSILWRTGSGGKIERSNDSGRTWQAQASPSLEDWLSGAAVSDTVCWLAGRNGVIARTLDGEHWDRVPPPAQAAGNTGKLPDWIGIAARDAQSATVTASDGHRFATTDGGKTWQALP